MKELIQAAYAKISQSCKTVEFDEASLQSKKGMSFSNNPCEKVIQKNEEIKVPKIIR